MKRLALVSIEIDDADERFCSLRCPLLDEASCRCRGFERNGTRLAPASEFSKMRHTWRRSPACLSATASATRSGRIVEAAERWRAADIDPDTGYQPGRPLLDALADAVDAEPGTGKP